MQIATGITKCNNYYKLSQSPGIPKPGSYLRMRQIKISPQLKAQTRKWHPIREKTCNNNNFRELI